MKTELVSRFKWFLMTHDYLSVDIKSPATPTNTLPICISKTNAYKISFRHRSVPVPQAESDIKCLRSDSAHVFLTAIQYPGICKHLPAVWSSVYFCLFLFIFFTVSSHSLAWPSNHDNTQSLSHRLMFICAWSASPFLSSAVSHCSPETVQALAGWDDDLVEVPFSCSLQRAVSRIALKATQSLLPGRI